MFKHFILLIHLILTAAELDIIVIVQMRELRPRLNNWLRNAYLLDKARLEIKAFNCYNCYVTIIIYFVSFMGKIISPQTKKKMSVKTLV